MCFAITLPLKEKIMPFKGVYVHFHSFHLSKRTASSMLRESIFIFHSSPAEVSPANGVLSGVALYAPEILTLLPLLVSTPPIFTTLKEEKSGVSCPLDL